MVDEHFIIDNAQSLQFAIAKVEDKILTPFGQAARLLQFDEENTSAAVKLVIADRAAGLSDLPSADKF